MIDFRLDPAFEEKLEWVRTFVRDKIEPLDALFPEHGAPWNPRNARTMAVVRSEEHTFELQSLMRISYAVFCLKKKNNTRTRTTNKLSTINRTMTENEKGTQTPK